MIPTLAALAATEDAGAIVGLVFCLPGVMAAIFLLVIRDSGGQQ